MRRGGAFLETSQSYPAARTKLFLQSRKLTTRGIIAPFPKAILGMTHSSSWTKHFSRRERSWGLKDVGRASDAPFSRTCMGDLTHDGGAPDTVRLSGKLSRGHPPALASRSELSHARFPRAAACVRNACNLGITGKNSAAGPPR